MATMNRRAVLGAVVASLMAPRITWAAVPSITVHKDPNCGCCSGWIDHLRANGFSATAIDTTTLDRVKARLGVPDELASCHTAEIEGYIMEGHVPARAITKLLAERPKVRGLAVPAMPAGSPGMGGEPEAYDVIAFGDGATRVFGRYKATDEI